MFESPLFHFIQTHVRPYLCQTLWCFRDALVRSDRCPGLATAQRLVGPNCVHARCNGLVARCRLRTPVAGPAELRCGFGYCRHGQGGHHAPPSGSFGTPSGVGTIRVDQRRLDAGGECCGNCRGDPHQQPVPPATVSHVLVGYRMHPTILLEKQRSTQQLVTDNDDDDHPWCIAKTAASSPRQRDVRRRNLCINFMAK